MKKSNTIPTYSYEDTSDPNIKRFVDREKNWTHYWLVKEKKFVKAVNHILSLGYNKGPRFAQYLLSVTKEEAHKKLTTAGDEGTRTHSAFSDLIAGSRVTMTTKYPSDLVGGKQEPLNDNEWNNLQAFENWCAVYKPRLVAQDQTVCGGTYAGTFDALLTITVPDKDKRFREELWGKDILILMDWKTSAAIYDEYKAQLAAYWFGIMLSHKWDAFVRAYPEKEFSGILRVGSKHKAGYEFQVWNSRESAGNYALFNAAQTIADDAEPTFEPEIEQIKTEFAIKVPKAVVEKPKKLTKKVLDTALKEIGDNLEEKPKKERKPKQLPLTAQE